MTDNELLERGESLGWSKKDLQNADTVGDKKDEGINASDEAGKESEIMTTETETQTKRTRGSKKEAPKVEEREDLGNEEAGVSFGELALQGAAEEAGRSGVKLVAKAVGTLVTVGIVDRFFDIRGGMKAVVDYVTPTDDATEE